MSESQLINLFIPTKLTKCSCGLLFGYFSLSSHPVLNLSVNITAIALLSKTSNVQLNIEDEEISLLGQLNDEEVSGHRRRTNAFENSRGDRKFWCKLNRVNRGNDIEVECLMVDNSVIDNKNITLIYYDTRDFMCSQLFGKEDVDGQRLEFVEFLIDSLKRTSNVFKNHVDQSCAEVSLPVEMKKEQLKKLCNQQNQNRISLMFPRKLTASFIEFHHEQNKPKVVKKHVRNKSWFPNQTTITNTITDTIMMTATGRQVRFRFWQFSHCYEIIRGLRHKRMSMSAGNTLLSVAIDMLIGILITWFLVFFSSPSHYLDIAMKQTDRLVNEVQLLLNLLMSMPAGLKLNRPLNTALAQFFLYHIYLWKTYMIIIRPLFAVTVETLVFCGVFGSTCILSVLSDLVSLATIHIYCFYGYAARLYGLQVNGLMALWRLFRGKKWNQLRQRVDSYSYGIDQLFIGTLSFTIVLFLLPTVLMYYLVFLVLRVVTLSVQGVIRLLISTISSLPIYMIFLWLIDSKKVAGQVTFEILNRNCQTVKLRLDTNRVSFGKILKMKNDQSTLFHSNVPLSWYDFFQSIIWGKIIYPL